MKKIIITILLFTFIGIGNSAFSLDYIDDLDYFERHDQVIEDMKRQREQSRREQEARQLKWEIEKMNDKLDSLQ